MGLTPFPDEERVRIGEKVSKNMEASRNCDDIVSRNPVSAGERKRQSRMQTQ